MTKLNALKPNRGARQKKIRRGRGDASGYGSFSGRGCKGQKARTGGKVRPGFEGGQTPLLQRMPKRRGFKNPSRTAYIPVNLWTIEERFLAQENVSPITLREKKVLRRGGPVKILGQGELSKSLTFTDVICSEAAKVKIEKAGGSVVVS